MGTVRKTYQEINEKIRKGQAVVVTAEEMIGIVKKKGPARAAREVDVVTTGTFAPMCSSGAFINFGHTNPPMKASKVWLNDVPAYGGLAAVDIYIGVNRDRPPMILSTKSIREHSNTAAATCSTIS